MTGSVRKKGDRWYYSFEMATIDGKRNRIERSGGRTKKEALAKLREAIIEYERGGSFIDETNMSVAEYMKYWIENYVMLNNRLHTQQLYKSIVKNHINPKIGKYRLKSIQPGILQNLITSKYNDGYSLKTLQVMKAILTGSFTHAVYPYQFIKENPATYIKLPKDKRKKSAKDLKIITVENFKKIIECCPPGNKAYIPLQVGFYTGMRLSEILGLTWDNVDLEMQTIKVAYNLEKKEDGTYWLAPPKSSASYRTIQISKYLTQILRDHKVWQNENRLKYGAHYYTSEYNFVCTRENGKVLNDHDARHEVRKARKKLGLDFNFHGLRHTHASMLLAEGVNIKMISERLGHGNISITLDTYSHITEKMNNDTLSVLDSMIQI